MNTNVLKMGLGKWVLYTDFNLKTMSQDRQTNYVFGISSFGLKDA